MLLSRASTIISVKGYTGFKVNKPLRERKQLADGISAVKWPIFQTKSSYVAVEKNKCTYSKKVEKIIYQRKCIYGSCAYKSCGNSVLLLMLFVFVNQFIPPNFAVLHRLRPVKFAVPLILLYSSLSLSLKLSIEID